jgi:ribosomal protein S18 acetylase RimI-like enzyme
MRAGLIEHHQRCRPRTMSPSAQGQQDQQDYRATCQAKIEWEGCLYLVAESPEGAVVGMGEIHLADRPDLVQGWTAKINDLWVDPVHRRRGLASTLAETLLVFAASRGIETIWLDWVAGNREAEGLWSSLGFAPTTVQAVLERRPQ